MYQASASTARDIKKKVPSSRTRNDSVMIWRNGLNLLSIYGNFSFKLGLRVKSFPIYNLKYKIHGDTNVNSQLSNPR